MNIKQAKSILDNDHYWDALYNSMDRLHDGDVHDLIEAMKVDHANGGDSPVVQLKKYGHGWYKPSDVIKELQPLIGDISCDDDDEEEELSDKEIYEYYKTFESDDPWRFGHVMKKYSLSAHQVIETVNKFEVYGTYDKEKEV